METRLSLHAHAAAKGEEIRAKYGPNFGWHQLLEVLRDRDCVRYPTEIVFDSGPLLEGELAHPVMKGNKPEEGFIMYVHPFFAIDSRAVIYLVLYQLVVVNYGTFASSGDAEIFGANALGISKETYYLELCQVADSLAGSKMS